MTEIDFAGDARGLCSHFGLCDRRDECVNCKDMESALRSIAQRVQEEADAEMGMILPHCQCCHEAKKSESEIRADERAKVLDAVTGSLTGFPILGGHKPIMEQVDRIVSEARADERRSIIDRMQWAREDERRRWAERMEAEAGLISVTEVSQYMLYVAKRLRENSDE